MLSFVYWLSFCLLCMSFSSLIPVYLSPLKLRKLSKIIIGASTTPFFLGGYFLIIPFFIPTINITQSIYLLCLFSLVITAYQVKRIFIFCFEVKKKSSIYFSRILSGKISAYTVIANGLFALTFSVFLGVLFVNATKQIREHDAVSYYAESLAFAKKFTPQGIPGFEAGAGELVKTNPHTFLYQSYIAGALGADKTKQMAMGFPNDYSARLAGQILELFFILMIMVLAYESFIHFAPQICFMLTILVPFVAYPSADVSRDAFRLIPLAWSLMLAIGYIRQPVGHYMIWLTAYAFAIALGIYAHTINIVILMFLYAIFSCVLLFRVQAKYLIKLISIVSVGFVIGLIPYIYNFWVYGDLLGYGMIYKSTLNTPVYEVATKARLGRVQVNFAEGIRILCLRYGVYLPIIAMMFGLRSIPKVFRSTTHLSAFHLVSAIYILIIILSLLPFLYIGSPIPFNQAFLMNNRYNFTIMCLTGLVACFPLARFLFATDFSWLKNVFKQKEWMPSTQIVALVFIALITYLNLHDFLVTHTWIKPQNVFFIYNKKVETIQEEVNHLKNQYWMTDDIRTVYYTQELPPNFIYSKKWNALLKAKDEQEVVLLLDNWSIPLVVVFKDATLAKTKGLLPFYDTLNNPTLFNKSEKQGIEFYWRKRRSDEAG